MSKPAARLTDMHVCPMQTPAPVPIPHVGGPIISPGHPQTLIAGLPAARVTDLAVNVVLPWVWMRAVDGRNDALRSELERRYLEWPAAEDNAVLRLARQRLLGAAPPRALQGAAGQQGLLQIVRDFCEHSNALCTDCRFPELVRQWPG